MKKHSNKRAIQERNLRKAEKELNQELSNMACFFYPELMRREYDHIIPKSQNQSLIDCKDNLIPISGKAHEIITRGTVDDLLSLPTNRFREYLDRMKDLDESYYNRYMIKFDGKI